METAEIGVKLKERRKNNRLTQQQAADMAGVALNVIKAIEAGRDSVKLSSLIKVSELFGFRVDLAEGSR